jgi:hypothetical protein
MKPQNLIPNVPFHQFFHHLQHEGRYTMCLSLNIVGLPRFEHKRPFDRQALKVWHNWVLKYSTHCCRSAGKIFLSPCWLKWLKCVYCLYYFGLISDVLGQLPFLPVGNCFSPGLATPIFARSRILYQTPKSELYTVPSRFLFWLVCVNRCVVWWNLTYWLTDRPWSPLGRLYRV